MDHSPGCKCGACAADANKVSKTSVNYRPGKQTHCHECSMFCPPAQLGYGTCTLVRGKIARLDTCDRFEKKR